MDPYIYGILLSIFASLCWGTTVILIKIVLEKESPLVSIIIRGISAVFFILILVYFAGWMHSFTILFQIDIFLLIIIGGFLNALGEIVYFNAIKIGKISIVQPVSSISPIFIAIILIINGIEFISLLTIIGTIFTVIGVIFISQKDENNKNKDNIKSKEYYMCIIFSIAAPLFWSISLIILRIVFEYPGINTYSVTALRFSASTIFTIIIWLIISISKRNHINNKEKKTSISRRNIIILIYAGIITWGIGSVAYFESIRLINISRASPITSISPLISVILGTIILKEKLNKFQIVSILIIVLGTIFVCIG